MNCNEAQEAVYGGAQVTRPGAHFHLEYDGLKIMRRMADGFATVNTFTEEELAAEDWELRSDSNEPIRLQPAEDAPWNLQTNVQNLIRDGE